MVLPLSDGEYGFIIWLLSFEFTNHLGTFLCAQCDASKRAPISQVREILPSCTGRAQTEVRHTQPRGENGFDPYNISKPEGTACHRDQAPICTSVTNRKPWKPEMLSCPATSQTLAYRHLYLCINCIMQFPSSHFKRKKIILNNPNDYDSIELSKVWRNSLSFKLNLFPFTEVDP